MKTTAYYEYSVRKRRPEIKDEWVEKALSQPDHVQPQAGGRIRHYLYIEEYGKFLRVVIEDGKVHNAFLDRRFKPTKH